MRFWKGHNKENASERNFGWSVFYWLLGTVAIYASMFGVGHVLRLEYATGVGLLVFGVVALFVMVQGMSQIDRRKIT